MLGVRVLHMDAHMSVCLSVCLSVCILNRNHFYSFQKKHEGSRPFVHTSEETYNPGISVFKGQVLNVRLMKDVYQVYKDVCFAYF